MYATVCVIITFLPLMHTQSATRGTVNGIAQSLVAVGRSIGPLIGAPLFAWSANTGRWAINRVTNVNHPVRIKMHGTHS